ncbi:AAA family ATPase [Thiotrichales bacterium HSG1]|nr:AAA family ATPase [Thiotrichales bacterium HSG1]
MKIKILSLTVKNSGALEDVKIDFTNDGAAQSVIVLGGANGSGKTTVLELIFSLIELLQFKDFEQYAELYNGSINSIFKYTEYAELELLINKRKQYIFFNEPPSFSTEIHNNENKHGLVYKSSVDHIKIHDIYHSDISEGIFNLITSEKCKPLSLLTNKATFVEPILHVPSLPIPSTIYFPYNRELSSVKGEQIHKEVIKYQWCYRYENKLNFQGSLESYLIWLDYAEPEEFKVILDFMNQLDFGGKTFYINRKELSVIVKTKNGQHSFDKLSSGEQNILIMLLELYRRLIPGSIVLIDEIENSLHPAFYHHLAQNLLKLQKQIPFQLILTTHQPAFVKIFGESCTRILTEF